MSITKSKKTDALNKIKAHRKLLKKIHVNLWRMARWASFTGFIGTAMLLSVLFFLAVYQHKAHELDFSLGLLASASWLLIYGIFNNKYFSHWTLLRILDFPNRWSERLIKNLEVADQ